MSKITVIIGPSGSGKSTLAHKMWKEDPLNTVIVNRDNIRNLLFGYNDLSISEHYQDKNFSKLEKEVTLYENSIITNALSKGKHIIADNTHLSKEYIYQYRLWNVPIELIWMDVDIKECINRDFLRDREVGKEIIKKQFNKFKSLKENIDLSLLLPVKTIPLSPLCPACIVVDIDGTVAYKGDRDIYDFSKVELDTPNQELISILENLSPPYHIIFCSGRGEECREETVKWICDKFIMAKSQVNLYMRKEKDYRPDWIIKEELWRKISEYFNIKYLFDDRDQVVIRARALGLQVAQVNYGFF